MSPFSVPWRYQDKNTGAFFLLRAAARWLAFRGDLLSNFLVTSVSAGALLATQSPGKFVMHAPTTVSVCLSLFYQ